MNSPVAYSDTSGKETLLSISKAGAFNRWMYAQIEPYTKGKILEIGSGIGNISEFFVKDNAEIHLSDLREDYLSLLQTRYENTPIHCIDIADVDFDQHYSHLIGKFDSVFCLNVIEHIKDDRRAVDNLNQLLRPGGSLIVLVPAFALLYNGLDKSLGHYKRYHARDMQQLLPNKSRIRRLFYFNVMGIVAWMLGGAIFNHKVVPEGNMTLYNRFVPLWKIIDKIFGRWVGLSLIVIGEKGE